MQLTGDKIEIFQFVLLAPTQIGGVHQRGRVFVLDQANIYANIYANNIDLGSFALRLVHVDFSFEFITFIK